MVRQFWRSCTTGGSLKRQHEPVEGYGRCCDPACGTSRVAVVERAPQGSSLPARCTYARNSPNVRRVRCASRTSTRCGSAHGNQRVVLLAGRTCPRTAALSPAPATATCARGTRPPSRPSPTGDVELHRPMVLGSCGSRSGKREVRALVDTACPPSHTGRWSSGYRFARAAQ